MAMGATQLSDVANQVQTFWSALYMPELLERSVLPALVNRAYEGEIKAGGSTVRVSQINRPEATIKQVGSNEDSFESNKLSTDYVDVVANQVITASFEFNDLAFLQSQIGEKESEIRSELINSALIKLNTYVYSLVAPSTSSPDHSIASVTDFNASEVLKMRKLAAQAKWKDDGRRYLLADPSYYNDLLSAQTLTSSDYGGDDAPVVGGKILKQRFGFWIAEDNSAGMSALSPTAASEDYALAFHPDFMYLVMGQPEFKVSDLHSQKRHGFLISVRMIVGAKLGIDGAVKHIVAYNS